MSPHVPRQWVFDSISAGHTGFPAASPLCSYSSQGKVGCEQESVPRGGGGGVCDAQSPSPHPSPQQSYSEMDFKAYVRAGMSKLVSLSWYKRHRPEKG